MLIRGDDPYGGPIRFVPPAVSVANALINAYRGYNEVKYNREPSIYGPPQDEPMRPVSRRRPRDDPVQPRRPAPGNPFPPFHLTREGARRAPPGYRRRRIQFKVSKKKRMPKRRFKKSKKRGKKRSRRSRKRSKGTGKGDRFKKRIREIIRCQNDRQYTHYYNRGIISNQNVATAGGSKDCVWDFSVPPFPNLNILSSIILNNLPAGTTSASQYVCELVQQVTRTTFLNVHSHPVHMSIFACRSRSFTGNLPISDMTTAFTATAVNVQANETAIGVSVTGNTFYGVDVGVTPYELSLFCARWKVRRFASFTLYPGKTRRISQKTKKCMKVTKSQFTQSVAGAFPRCCTQFLIVCTPCISAVKGTEASVPDNELVANLPNWGEFNVQYVQDTRFNYSTFGQLPEKLVQITNSIVEPSAALVEVPTVSVISSTAGPGFNYPTQQPDTLST